MHSYLVFQNQAGAQTKLTIQAQCLLDPGQSGLLLCIAPFVVDAGRCCLSLRFSSSLSSLCQVQPWQPLHACMIYLHVYLIACMQVPWAMSFALLTRPQGAPPCNDTLTSDIITPCCFPASIVSMMMAVLFVAAALLSASTSAETFIAIDWNTIEYISRTTTTLQVKRLQLSAND